MTDPNAQEALHIEEYRKFGPAQLNLEFHHIRDHHKKETMMEDLVRMSALMTVMKEKGIPIPGETNRNAPAGAPRPGQATQPRAVDRYRESQQSSVNWVKVVLGFVIFGVGLALTFGNSGAIFYGAILVGFFMIIAGFMGS